MIVIRELPHYLINYFLKKLATIQIYHKSRSERRLLRDKLSLTFRYSFVANNDFLAIRQTEKSNRKSPPDDGRSTPLTT